MKKGFYVFLAGIVVGIVICSFLTLSQPENANADSTSGNSKGIFAVSGKITKSISGVWVVDTKESEYSPTICLYVPNSEGRGFQLRAVRRIKYDLKLSRYYDTTREKTLHIPYLKKNWEKVQKQQEKKRQEIKNEEKYFFIYNWYYRWNNYMESYHFISTQNCIRSVRIF